MIPAWLGGLAKRAPASALVFARRPLPTAPSDRSASVAHPSDAPTERNFHATVSRRGRARKDGVQTWPLCLERRSLTCPKRRRLGARSASRERASSLARCASAHPRHHASERAQLAAAVAREPTSSTSLRMVSSLWDWSARRWFLCVVGDGERRRVQEPGTLTKAAGSGSMLGNRDERAAAKWASSRTPRRSGKRRDSEARPDDGNRSVKRGGRRTGGFVVSRPLGGRGARCS